MMLTHTNFWLIKVTHPATQDEGYLKLGISDIYTDATPETATRFETIEDAEEIAGMFNGDLSPVLPSWNPKIIQCSVDSSAPRA